VVLAGELQTRLPRPPTCWYPKVNYSAVCGLVLRDRRVTFRR
jgi:hypothetical protein